MAVGTLTIWGGHDFASERIIAEHRAGIGDRALEKNVEPSLDDVNPLVLHGVDNTHEHRRQAQRLQERSRRGT